MHPDDDATRVPIIEEQVVVKKISAVTDRIRVSTTFETRDVLVEDTLSCGNLSVERTTMNLEVSPPPRRVRKGTC